MTLRQLFGAGRVSLAVAALLTVLHTSPAHAQDSLEAFQGIYAGNFGAFAAVAGNGGPNDASDPFQATVQFTGDDHNGAPQTMTVSGTAYSSASFGQMHVYGSGTITNSYYSPTNTPYTEPDGTVHLDGSPDLVAVHGNAGWADTFTYTGLQGTGYKVNYYFALEGTATGDVEAGLNFSTSDPSAPSYNPRTNAGSALWITPDYQVDWDVPFTVSADFYGGMTTYVSQYPDGSAYSATGDYADTLTLAGIQIVDANGTPVTGWSLVTSSGTQYPLGAPTPEPGSLALLGSAVTLGAGTGLRRLRRARRRTL